MKGFKLMGTLLACACLTPVAAGAFGKTSFDEIVAFGDSSTDTGNVAALQCDSDTGLPKSEFLPNFVFLSPCTPIDPATGTSAYFDDNLSNGPLWLEFLADAMGVPRPAASESGGTNYAHAGSKAGLDFLSDRSDPDVNLRFNLYCQTPPDCFIPGSQVPTAITQVEQYKASEGEFTPEQLVVLWTGANDLRDAAGDPAGSEAGALNVVGNIVEAVRRVAVAGNSWERRHVAVLNQLNASRAPIAQLSCAAAGDAEACLAEIEEGVKAFNLGLALALKRLQWELYLGGHRTRIHYIDVYTAGEAAVEISELVGFPFTNTTEPALTPDFAALQGGQGPLGKIAEGAEDYLFWDVIHLTEKAQKVIAVRVCKALDRRIRGFEPNCGSILTAD